MTEISKLRLLANDDAADTLERQKAIGEALRLTEQLANERMANEKEQLRIMKLEASFSKSDAETLNAIAEKEREIILLKKTQFDASRMMIMKQTTINNKLKKQLELEESIAEAKFGFADEAEIPDEDPAVMAAGKRANELVQIAKDAAAQEVEVQAATMAEIEDSYKKGLITYDEYLAAKGKLEKETSEKTIGWIMVALDAASEATDSLFQIYQNRLEKEDQELQKQRDFELSLAGENKEKQAQINEKFDKKSAAIKTKAAKADRRAAIIQANISIAGAILQALFNLPPPVSYIMAGISAALGALQLAAIASQPIPQFFKGTDSAPDGLISVGERGRELIETKSGKRFMANNPTITSGLAGAKIYTNTETERIMRGSGYDSIDLREVVESNREITKAIKNQKQITYDRANRTITERKGQYFKTYLNAKVGSW